MFQSVVFPLFILPCSFFKLRPYTFISLSKSVCQKLVQQNLIRRACHRQLLPDP